MILRRLFARLRGAPETLTIDQAVTRLQVDRDQPEAQGDTNSGIATRERHPEAFR